MPQSLSRVLIHTVFATKKRIPFLTDPDLRDETHAYIGGIAKKPSCNPITIGGTADHLHLLTTLSRTITIADFVKEIKRLSTNWINARSDTQTKFQWQSGYGVFSVSHRGINHLIRYIQNQEAHHKKDLFQDEYRSLLQEQAIEFDEQHLWD